MTTSIIISLLVSGTGAILTAIALLIAIVNLRAMFAANKEITNRQEQISQNLITFGTKLETLHQEITDRHEQISQNLITFGARLETLDEEMTDRHERISQNLMTLGARLETLDERMTERHERISQNFMTLETRLEVLDKEMTERHERINEELQLSAYRAELSGPAWKTRLRACQRQAARAEPAYLEPRPNDPVRYILTDGGRELLPADVKEDVIAILTEDISTENNVLILILGLPYLSRYVQEKQVELDILVGVTTSFADEIRQEGKEIIGKLGAENGGATQQYLKT